MWSICVKLLHVHKRGLETLQTKQKIDHIYFWARQNVLFCYWKLPVPSWLNGNKIFTRCLKLRQSGKQVSKQIWYVTLLNLIGWDLCTYIDDLGLGYSGLCLQNFSWEPITNYEWLDSLIGLQACGEKFGLWSWTTICRFVEPCKYFNKPQTKKAYHVVKYALQCLIQMYDSYFMISYCWGMLLCHFLLIKIGMNYDSNKTGSMFNDGCLFAPR